MIKPLPTDDDREKKPPQSRRRHRPARRVASVLVLIAAVGITVRVATLRGLIAPVRISGSSMAETFAGEHYALLCGDCGIPFRCGIDVAPADGLATCPNCGFGENAVNGREAQSGERVLIDRLASFVGAPQRYDVVALKTPGREDYLQVKRIVGLPGEQLTIRAGELFADGRLLQKSLQQLRAVAIPVNDDTYRSTAAAGDERASRWAPDRADSHWQAQENGFQFAPAADESNGLDWLTYRHLRSFAGHDLRREDPVRDNYGYNQSLSRHLFEVGDLLLSCNVAAAGAGVIAVSIHDGRDRHEARFTADGRLLVLQNDVQIASLRAPPLSGQGAIRLEFAVCDRQLLLAVEGKELLRRPFAESQRPFQPTSRPIAVGVQGLSVSISNLQVSRDIYYLDPARSGGEWSTNAALGQDQYLLLGDNTPISLDGRRWSPAGIERKHLLGDVLRFPGG